MSGLSIAPGVADLTQAIDELMRPASCIDGLAAFAARLQQVIPFVRCHVIHERWDGSVAGNILQHSSRGLVSPCESRRQVWRGAPLGLAWYAASLCRLQSVGNAFLWRGTTGHHDGLDRRLVEIAGSARDAGGIAAGITASHGTDGDVTTLIQLECAEGTTSADQLPFLGCIVQVLHLALVSCAANDAAGQNADSGLTAKEREVFRWIVEGKTAWEVGRILAVSERTIKFHLSNIYTKLNVSNRAQAVSMASRMKLI